MSSQYSGAFPPMNAINNKGSCAIAKIGKGNWWKGEFKNGFHLISSVRIRNRIDCCGERLAGVIVKIDDQVCGSLPENTKSGEWYTVECSSAMTGYSVTLEMARNDYLQIAGVEVSGK